MNIFDVVVYIALAWAVLNGWRKGFLLQLVSLVAIVVALFLAARCSSSVGSLLGLGSASSSVVGFIVIFLVALIAITICGYLMRAILKISGLGPMDVILGIVFSILKVSLIVGVMFSWVSTINNHFKFVPQSKIEQSLWFEPVKSVAECITSCFGGVAENIKNQ